MTAHKLKIDIVSDVVCPWCIIGYKQLEKALDMVGDDVEAEITWHPFELNPTMVPEGEAISEHVARKYGATPQQSASNRQRLTDLGDKLGFGFHYGPDMRIYNTFKAHQLLTWAGDAYGSAAQTRLKLALFSAYFQANRDVSDEEVLLSIVAEAGLDADEGRAVLNDPDNEAEVRAHLDHWIEQGISGVPAIIFDGKYLVPGAQEAETFVNVIRKVREKALA
ncbi:DsbA family oxidoreductase [Blastomonas sp. UPD001]|jgi:predicted DsbA family dithiol-disulfide isomerase|uniref:DsbA family oxidoreductase n=1 Tax=Blastomonas sp. UPD001 TaxID=2217673 RepID=UPI001E286274|nr:DsbA family oxidoreductase [Blastomonas sp. UPD001]MBL0967067.1 DsbA family oxidoreductase [Blastomonas sp.]